VNGDHDLSTPLEWARQELKLAPQGRLVVVPGAGHWIELLPVADGDPRTPLHAKVRIGFGGRTVLQEFTIQPSYASGSYVPLHFGLGSATRLDSLRVTWPVVSSDLSTMGACGSDPFSASSLSLKCVRSDPISLAAIGRHSPDASDP